MLAVKKRQAEKAEREFFQLLREHKAIKPGDIWKEVCTPSGSDNLVNHLYILTRSQAKRRIDPKDPRYDAVGSSSLREELFATYVKTVTNSLSKADMLEESAQGEDQGHDDDATRRKRAERAERGLREREERVRRDRAGLERELGRTRGAVGREEGEREFMCVLSLGFVARMLILFDRIQDAPHGCRALSTGT